MDLCPKPRCVTPFHVHDACQEGGVMHYKLKFILAFKFRINLKLLQNCKKKKKLKNKVKLVKVKSYYSSIRKLEEALKTPEKL